MESPQRGLPRASLDATGPGRANIEQQSPGTTAAGFGPGANGWQATDSASRGLAPADAWQLAVMRATDLGHITWGPHGGGIATNQGPVANLGHVANLGPGAKGSQAGARSSLSGGPGYQNGVADGDWQSYVNPLLPELPGNLQGQVGPEVEEGSNGCGSSWVSTP
jgi:hypothetical protein